MNSFSLILTREGLDGLFDLLQRDYLLGVLYGILLHHSYFIRCSLLKNGSIVKPYTGNMCMREMLKNFLQSHRAVGAYYLCSEAATYIRSGKENTEPIWKIKEEQVRTELYNQWIDWAVTRGERPNAVSSTWEVEGWNQGLMTNFVVL